MDFRQWFEDQEWPGASFDGDSNSRVNTPDYWPNSKWQGKGQTYGAPSHLDKVEKMFKLKPPLVVKRMKKKA